MNIIDNLSKHLKEVTGMNNEYFVLIVVSLIVFIGVKVINKIISKTADRYKDKILYYTYPEHGTKRNNPLKMTE